MRGVRSWLRSADLDPRHDERVASILGIALGVSFSICFVTGIYSHLVQHPTTWFSAPARPAGLYRFTQGLHVATGIASIPLLLAKLWAVFPRLFVWPPATSVAHALERLSLVPLVGGALFQLVTGVLNIDLWYVVPFNFVAAHYWMAWITIGGLVIHIGAKSATVRLALRRQRGPEASEEEDRRPATAAQDASDRDAHTRRRFLAYVGASASAITVVTVGQTFAPLKELALLAPRDPDVGPQGFPVNGSAAEAGVIAAITDPNWRMRLVGAVSQPLELSIDDLRSMPQREATLPIACVEGWSANARWRGIQLSSLLDLAGAGPDAWVTVRSSQDGGFGTADVNTAQSHDPDTLLALEVNGEILSLDHGYPIRLIGPNRPGVMQTKWIREIEVNA